MALRNPKLFGLNVESLFADVQNKSQALQAINLPPLDLEVIGGSMDQGATRHDWISFSRLSVPLHKTLDRYDKDSSQYIGVLNERAGTDSSLFGNLSINGALSGNAIRYRFLDGTGNSTAVRIADISTSRVSAWSSSANPVLPESPISYGARVGITTGGTLKFGTQSTAATAAGSRIQTSIVPQAKEFPSEFPTHKVKISINGVDREIYTMKGIPVVFKGFFRNLNAEVKLTSLINNIAASWKIVEVANSNRYSNYTNQGGTTSTIRFRSSSSRERFIQFYYNPDNISSIQVRSANISSLPAVKFQNATTIDFAYNQLKNFPDLTFIAPNIESLFLMRNPFYLSETESERKLQNSSYTGGATTGTVLDKIPTGTRRIYMEGTFYGSITQNIFANRFTNLSVINFSRGGGAYFHPDSADSSGTLPNVSNTVEEYSFQSNDFRAIDQTANGTTQRNCKQLENMITLAIGSNYYLSDSTFSISSQNNVIKTVSIFSTGLPIPTGLVGSITLENFQGYYGRNMGKLVDLPNNVDYKFDNCSALRTINLYGSNVDNSRFPVFTNVNLDRLDLRYSRVRGGAASGDDTYVIPRNTFQSTVNLRYILIDSGNLLTNPIHPDALTDVQKLYYFWYRSYNRTGGSLPSFSSNPELRYIWVHHNAFTGVAPNLAANQSIYYARLSNNRLSGQVPTYRNLSRLRYLFLYNNQLTGIGDFENLPALQYLYLHNNQISGEIPDFSECPRLYYLILFNNQFTNYKSGALKENYRIRYIDLSNNNLTQQAMEQLIDDLYENWVAVNRGRVTVNLRGNGSPSEDTLDQIAVLRSKGWNITHD